MSKIKRKELEKDSYYGEYATSLRMSEIGYTNNVRCNYIISLSDLPSFIAEIREATQTKSHEFAELGLIQDGKYIQLNENILQIENEYYAPIRPRQLLHSLNGKLSDALEQKGVGYLEIRSLDVDPFSRAGVNEEQIQFIQLFLLYCLCKDDSNISCNEQEEINENRNRVAFQGRNKECWLNNNKQKVSLKEWGKNIIDEMKTLLNNWGRYEHYLQLLTKQQQKIEDASLTPSAIILEKIKDSGKSYLEYGVKLASKYKKEFLNHRMDKMKAHELKTLAKNSLVNQKILEETDSISFDEFLKKNQQAICTKVNTNFGIIDA